MSPVTGLTQLAGRSLTSVHMANFSPVRELRFQLPVTVHMGNFSLVGKMNKAQPFKFHLGNQAGVFIWEYF